MVAEKRFIDWFIPAKSAIPILSFAMQQQKHKTGGNLVQPLGIQVLQKTLHFSSHSSVRTQGVLDPSLEDLVSSLWIFYCFLNNLGKFSLDLNYIQRVLVCVFTCVVWVVVLMYNYGKIAGSTWEIFIIYISVFNE